MWLYTSCKPHNILNFLLPTNHPREDTKVTRLQHYKAVCELILVQGATGRWNLELKSKVTQGNVRVTSSVIVFKLANGIGVLVKATRQEKVSGNIDIIHSWALFSCMYFNLVFLEDRVSQIKQLAGWKITQ